MFLERAADLHRALHRRFRIGVKDQHHPIASWDPNQTVRGSGSLKLLGPADDPVWFLNCRVLAANRKLRVANNIDEQLVRLPTGDGMALVFCHSPEEPAHCALEIAEALRKHLRNARWKSAAG